MSAMGRKRTLAAAPVFLNCSDRYRQRMPKPPMPRDLKHSPDCGKVMGDHKGWFGPQCFCGREPGDALRGAHGGGTGGNAKR